MEYGPPWLGGWVFKLIVRLIKMSGVLELGLNSLTACDGEVSELS